MHELSMANSMVEAILDTAKKNDAIKINEAVDILGVQTRKGYEFEGWTKTQGGTEAEETMRECADP